MTQTVNVPTCDFQLGRAVPVDLLSTQSVQSANKSKRYLQQKLNNSFLAVDKELDQDILNIFLQAGAKIISVKTYHNSPSLSACISLAKYNEVVGLSFIVFEFEDRPKLFQFSICKKGDNFSRLEGRVNAKRRALVKMKKSLPITVYDKITREPCGVTKQDPTFGLYTYPVHEKYPNPTNQSITPQKIGNWIVKNFIKKEKEVFVTPSNPLKFKNEDLLLTLAKGAIASKYNIDLDSMKLYTSHVRYYENKFFSGLLATPQWFAELEDEYKKLVSNGGYTAYAIVGKVKDTETTNVFVAFSRCSKEENFTKEYGRKQCLINFAKDKIHVFSLSRPLDSMTDALVKLTENIAGRAINVVVDNAENGALPDMASVVKS